MKSDRTSSSSTGGLGNALLRSDARFRRTLSLGSVGGGLSCSESCGPSSCGIEWSFEVGVKGLPVSVVVVGDAAALLGSSFGGVGGGLSSSSSSFPVVRRCSGRPKALWKCPCCAGGCGACGLPSLLLPLRPLLPPVLCPSMSSSTTGRVKPPGSPLSALGLRALVSFTFGTLLSSAPCLLLFSACFSALSITVPVPGGSVFAIVSLGRMLIPDSLGSFKISCVAC